MSVSVESPFPDFAWPSVWHWIQPFQSRIADDYGPKTLKEFVDMHLQMEAHTWGVYRDGELGGLICIEKRTPVLAQTHLIFKKSFWGRATTETAIREVYDRVFQDGVLKIGSYVFQNNHAIISLAKAIGAREEGVLRNQTMQNGKPVNMVALGLLKEDFYATNGNSGRTDGRVRVVGHVEQQVENNNIDERTELHGGTAAHSEHAARGIGDRPHEPWQGSGPASNTSD